MGSEAPVGLQPSLGRENLGNWFEHWKSMSLPSHPSSVPESYPGQWGPPCRCKLLIHLEQKGEGKGKVLLF